MDMCMYSMYSGTSLLQTPMKVSSLLHVAGEQCVEVGKVIRVSLIERLYCIHSMHQYCANAYIHAMCTCKCGITIVIM